MFDMINIGDIDFQYWFNHQSQWSIVGFPTYCQEKNIGDQCWTINESVLSVGYFPLRDLTFNVQVHGKKFHKWNKRNCKYNIVNI